jgi:TIR domain
MLQKVTPEKVRMAGGRKVFLCYRREDSAGITGRLKDRLEGAGFTAFMDTEDISSGTDWRIALRNAVTSSDVLIAIIGPSWLTAHDQDGRRRLDSPTDHVVDEIATALEHRVRAIPVLIDGTHMPASDVLPARLARLSDLQALPLRHNSFGADVERLMGEINPDWRAGSMASGAAAALGGFAAPVGPPGPQQSSGPAVPQQHGGPVTTAPDQVAARARPIAKPAGRQRTGLLSGRAKLIGIGLAVLVMVIVIAILVARLTGPPRLDQKGLTKHVPAPIRSQCQTYTPPQDPLQTELRVALTCHPEGNGAPQELDYLHYSSLDTAVAAYNSQLPDKLADSDCHRTLGQQTYQRQAASDGRVRRGNLACFQSTDYSTVLMWTDETIDTIAIARFRNGQSYSQSWDWWWNYGGPI